MSWTKVRSGLDYWPTNLGWDTCLGAHCLANHEPTSLKFQTYTKLGILGFDDAVDCYITKTAPGQDKKSCNSFNRIDECPMSVLLKYNAYDSLYTLQLQEIQEREISAHQMKGFSLFMDGAKALAKVQEHGMKIDKVQLLKNERTLTEKINAIVNMIDSMDEIKDYDKTLDLNSSEQLVKFVYDYLKMPVPPEGKSVDEKALSRFNKPIIKLLLKYRKATKIRDTFLSQFKREQWDGIIHPSFALNRVKTFRGSSSGPNFQNLPKHDKTANKMIRGIIHPAEGCKICEYDYRSIEVGVGATYHKDPQMLKYLSDESANMHTDTAIDIFMRDLDTYTKAERQLAKNKFVFPAFYGSSAKPHQGQKIGVVARDLWEGTPPETMAHLRSCGIRGIEDFQAHVIDVEDKMWNERFPVYSEWRNKTWKKYKRKGYLDLYTGFRVYGPLSYTQVVNIQTQGSAFHVLLHTLIKTAPRIFDLSGRTYVNGQIHECIVVNVHPEEEEEIDRLINYFGTVRLPEAYPELSIVPLIIEKDSSEIDGDWFNMTEIGAI
jgi:DNA polymerase I-like protein with 3'-5' exonuclease and polymerase domains